MNPETAASKEPIISCETIHGLEIQGTVKHYTRHQAVFEIYGPTAFLQTSEALENFKIIICGHVRYSGRAIVSQLVEAGPETICQVTLEEFWLDVGYSCAGDKFQLQSDFATFLQETGKSLRIVPEYKLVVADMQTMLMDLRLWLEQLEMGVRSQPSGSRLQFERDILQELARPAGSVLRELFEKFEAAAAKIEPDLRPAHASYIKRQLHPLVLCAPFMYRTFRKPLGFAGDYEMVNMMLRDPHEGASLFAKLLNNFFLATPPVVAHQNRVQLLTEMLLTETCRLSRLGRVLRVFNLGCGPAKEIQNFIAQQEISQRARFTLLDSSAEALSFTEQALNDIKAKHHRSAGVTVVRKSVAQFLRDGSKPTANNGPNSFDVVYCAGLFDYLPDHICQRLLKVCYDMLDPGGLLLATNVDASNPSRRWMEFSVDWHLTYRNHKTLTALAPPRALQEDIRISADASGVNVFMEVRKPADGQRT